MPNIIVTQTKTVLLMTVKINIFIRINITSIHFHVSRIEKIL